MTLMISSCLSCHVELGINVFRTKTFFYKHQRTKWKTRPWRGVLFPSPGQWPIDVIMGPVQAASDIPWRMSCSITPLPLNWFFNSLFLKALHLTVSSYVTKIQSLWPETARGARLHRQFPSGLMCFQSGDHLFPCLMSSVINKCMALISLRVAGALELVRSWGDGGSMPEFFWRWWAGHGEVAFEQMLSLLSAGWSFHDSFLSSDLLSCFSLRAPWPVVGLILDCL